MPSTPVTTRRRQTMAPLVQGVSRLLRSANNFTASGKMVRSPYFQLAEMRKKALGRDTKFIFVSMAKIGHLIGVLGSGTNLDAIIDVIDNGVSLGCWAATFDPSSATDAASMDALIWAAATQFGIDNSITVIKFYASQGELAPPMYVSGVAKTGYYAVVGSPAVAGGAGVARFYIDTNGDGTGIAPSEVHTASLQAVVWNSSNVYVPESLTVDTNRKYIDVTIGRLNFTDAVVSLTTVLTSASIGNAPNGTVVNCLVFVKK